MTVKLKLPKTITIELPMNATREVQAIAKKEHRSVSEVLLDAFKRDQLKKQFLELASETRRYAKKHKLTAEDFGGPFAE